MYDPDEGMWYGDEGCARDIWSAHALGLVDDDELDAYLGLDDEDEDAEWRTAPLTEQQVADIERIKWFVPIMPAFDDGYRWSVDDVEMIVRNPDARFSILEDHFMWNGDAGFRSFAELKPEWIQRTTDDDLLREVMPGLMHELMYSDLTPKDIYEDEHLWTLYDTLARELYARFGIFISESI